MNEAPDDLDALLSSPAAITVAGNPVTIKKLTIQHLPLARTTADQLFSDPAVRFDQLGFMFAIETHHIDLMSELIVLMSDLTKDPLQLPIADFMQLFNAVLGENEDFFLLAIRKNTPTNPASSAGPSSSND